MPEPAIRETIETQSPLARARHVRRACRTLFERSCDLPDQHTERGDHRYETYGSSKVEPALAGAGVDGFLLTPCHWRHRRTGERLLTRKSKSSAGVPKTMVGSAGVGPRPGNVSPFGFAIDSARHGIHLRNPHAGSARTQRCVMFRIIAVSDTLPGPPITAIEYLRIATTPTPYYFLSIDGVATAWR